MKLHHPPSGLQHGLEFLIDPHWSPEQAIAVIELLDDLRSRIWAHYELALLEHYREDRVIQAELPFAELGPGRVQIEFTRLAELTDEELGELTDDGDEDEDDGTEDGDEELEDET